MHSEDAGAPRFDANLAPILDALLTHQSVTAAGRELGLTQSAASHALARLRRFFGDALLVRQGARMVRTPRGEALAGPARRARTHLAELEQMSREPFSPRRSRGTVRIRAPGDVAWVFGARLAARLRDRAPGVDVVWTRAGPADLEVSAEPGPGPPLSTSPWVWVCAPEAAPDRRELRIGAADGGEEVEDLGVALAWVRAGERRARVPATLADAWASLGPLTQTPDEPAAARTLWLRDLSSASALERWVAEQLRRVVSEASPGSDVPE